MVILLSAHTIQTSAVVLEATLSDLPLTLASNIIDIRTAMTPEAFEHPETLAVMKGHSPWWKDGDPDDFAKVAVFMASEDADFVNGVNLPVDGGFMAGLG